MVSPDPPMNRDELVARIKREIDECLAAGESPDPSRWLTLLPDEADHLETLIALRTFAHEQERSSPDGASDEEERLLVQIQCELQDARNRGVTPDLTAFEARYPSLAPRLEALAAMHGFVDEALVGDHLPAPSANKSDESETALGRYRTVGLIADHPAGIAHLGVSRDSSAQVELLVLDPAIPRAQGWEILRDAERTRSLAGAGLLPARDVGEVRGVRFIASEHRPGESLSRILLDLAFHGGERGLRHVLPPSGQPIVDEQSVEDRAEANANGAAAASVLQQDRAHQIGALRLVRDVARATARAHMSGVLHCNLCPASVVISREGEPWVRWFGISRHMPRAPLPEVRTPLWLAPECVLERGEGRIDWRADVWGVGGLLLSLLRFEPPLVLTAADTDEARLAERWQASLQAHVAACPASLRPLLHRALAWEGVDRHQSCEALAEELEVVLRKLEVQGSGPPADAPGDEGGRRRWFRRRR